MLRALYHATKNPAWIWMEIAQTRDPGGISPEAFKYLHKAAKEIFEGVVQQACSLEKVRIVAGKQLEESILRQPSNAPEPPDVLNILGFRGPGANQFQRAAKDIRDMSFAGAFKDLVGRQGLPHAEAYVQLAMFTGRTSAETGPAIESIKQYVTSGKKLLGHRRKGQ